VYVLTEVRLHWCSLMFVFTGVTPASTAQLWILFVNYGWKLFLIGWPLCWMRVSLNFRYGITAGALADNRLFLLISFFSCV
jgi:hypothetical protein